MTDPTIGVAIAAATVFIIKEVAGVVAEWLKNEITTKQSLRHAILKIKAEQLQKELIIQGKVNERLKEKELEEALLDTTLEDVIKTQQLLKKMLGSINAKRVSIILFHNGIAKGFRNFSMRFEEMRHYSDSVAEKYQSKPLSIYYGAIKKFEETPYIVYDKLNLDYSDPFACTIEDLEGTHLIALPLLASKEQNVPDHHKLMSIKRKDSQYYILGIVTVTLDKESNPLTKSLLNDCIGLADDIMNIYEHNYKILG